MQRNGMAKKRRFLIDGEEWPGLVEVSALKDEEGIVEVPGYRRKTPIKDGVKMMDPLDCVYKIDRGTETSNNLWDWYMKDEYHDVIVIDTDATGAEVERFLLRDCECKKYDARDFNAGSVTWYGVATTITCTTAPVKLL